MGDTIGMAEEGNAARSRAMFGKYDIIETVGQGGMGIVYLAHDTGLDRVIALKVLRDDLRSNHQVVARFQREAEAFATLNHPNIVHIYSVGSVGRIPFISMEYIEGAPLSRIMRREKRIQWKRALSLTRQIAEALACAHDAHIIHRDIKPGNILVDKQDHAYVTDFGIAKVLTAETQLTVEGSRLGTPQYMSPERCMNKEITASSDIYSLGVVLFQMLTGRLPYEASTPIELIKKIVSDAPSRVSDHISDVPESVIRLVAYMIEKKPGDRPSSARDLAELIARIEMGKTLKEDDLAMASSLEAFRDTIPTPLSSRTTASDVLDSTWKERLLGLWTRTSDTLRVSIIGALIIAGATWIGLFAGEQMNRDFAPEIVRNIQNDGSSWRRQTQVSDFQQESQAVTLSRINLPAFAVDQIRFLDETHVAVQVSGIDRGARRDQSALCVLDLGQRASSMIITPKTTDDGQPAFSLLGARLNAGPDAEAPLYMYTRLLQTIQGEKKAAIFTGAVSQQESTDPLQLLTTDDIPLGSAATASPDIGPAAVNASGTVAAIALNAGKKQWSVVRVAIGPGSTPSSTIAMADAGPEIDWMDFTPDGSLVRFVRRPQKERYQLWVADAFMTGEPAELIYERKGTLSEGGISPIAERPVIVASTGGASPHLQLINLGSGEVEADLGPGSFALWHPSGEHLIALAPDNKDQNQIWKIGAAQPHTRTQLTYLSQGTGDICRISSDGKWVVSAAISQPLPVVVAVDLTQVP